MSVTRLKVLHVINSLHIGGAEVLLANTLSGHGLAGHVENVLAFFIGGSPLLQKIDASVKKVDLHYKGGLDLPFLLKRLRRLVKEVKPDIIHSHLNPAGSYVNMVKPKDTPQIHTLHTMYTQDRETKAGLRWLEQKTLFTSNSSGLIFLSKMLEKDFSSAISFKGQRYVLPNFIDDAFFLNPPPAPEKGRLKVVAIGTIRAVKNYDYLLDIFARLKDQNITLDIYGGGDPSALQRRIDEEDLPVKLMGQTTQVASVLPNYDLFIMGSHYEGYPLSVVEAMATGLPVLLSDIPSLRETAHEYATYFSLSEPDLAAEAVKAYLLTPERFHAQTLAGRAYAGEVGRKDRYIQRLLEIYHQTIHQRRPEYAVPSG